MSFGVVNRLRPQFLVRDRAVLTGNPQRSPIRFGIEVLDPVSQVPFEVTVFRYPAASGSPQLLGVHGFRGDHHGLELLVDGLAGFDVWVPDLPGFGASPAMPDADHSAANLSHVINQLAIRLEQPGIIGHSFGSVIAASSVAKNPQRYRHLVLVNPIVEPAGQTPNRGHNLVTALTDGFYASSAKLPRDLGRRLLANRWIVWATGAFMTKTDDHRILAYTHDQHRAYFSAFDSPEVLLQAYRASVESTVNQVASKLTLPVTIIGGELDELTGPQQLHGLANTISQVNDDVETYTLQRTGHLLHYERSVAAAALIQLRLRD